MTTTTTLLRRLAACAALALCLSAAPASAARYDDETRLDRTATGNLVDVQILVEGGTAPLYFVPGRWDRRYFQAFRGRHYALRVHNRTGQRVGVVIAVDGLNVVNGERSSLTRFEPMYVLDPYESATIRGWRTSLEQVRQFVFVDEERSYAERTGQANGDMGWIRVLSFAEQRPIAWFDRPWLRAQEEYKARANDELRRKRDADKGAVERELSGAAPTPDGTPAPAAPRAEKSQVGESRMEAAPRAMAQDMAPRSDAFPGTGWGERRHDPVRETRFDAAPSPSDRLAFRYEYASGLRALGIRLDGDRLRDRERGELGFAKPPRW